MGKIFIAGIVILIAYIFFSGIINHGSGGTIESLQYEIEELEEKVSVQEDCIEALQDNIYSVRSELGNYGESYDDLYYLVRESESSLEPEPFECN